MCIRSLIGARKIVEEVAEEARLVVETAVPSNAGGALHMLTLLSTNFPNVSCADYELQDHPLVSVYDFGRSL